MNKNKLLRSIALFLTIIVSIPIAYAQIFGGFTGSSLFFIIINSVIVGVILFVLQTFLIPKKEPKEQTAVWVAIIAGSLLIGWFFGSQDFIWQNPVIEKFFSIYVLVNTIVIGIALYFISGFLDINKKLGGSPEGKGGLGIIIFLIAVIFAVQIGNQFVWQKPVVQQFIDYLFGSQGILNPAPPEYRLWAFITVTLLLSFFFKGFLLPTGAGGTDKVNYALAILIGTSVARAGISFASIVLLGEAIFTIVLAKALQGTAPDVKGKSTNWILAAFLVGWASAAMTYGTEYQGWLAWIVGTPLWAMGLIQVGPTGTATQPSGTGWFGWIFKLGGGALVLLFLIPLLFHFIIGRGNKRASESWKKIKKYGIGPFMRELRSSRFPPLRWLAYLWQGKDPYIDGRLPLVFKDLRFELMTLMNYQTRLHTYFGKKNAVVEIKNQALGIEQHFASASKTYDGMRRSLDGYRFGRGGTVEGRDMFGWSNNDALIDEFFKRLAEALSVTRTISFESGGIAVKQPLTESMDAMLEKMSVAYGQYLSNTKRFGLIHRLRSLRISLVDLLAIYGVYKHYYRFANENAIFELWRVKIEDNIEKDNKGNVVNDENGSPKKTNEDVLWSATPLKRIEKYEQIVQNKIDESKNKVRKTLLDSIKKELNYDEKIKTLNSNEKMLLDREIDDKVDEELETEKSWNNIIKFVPKKYKLDYVNNLQGVGPIRHEVDIKGFVLADFHSIEVYKKKIKYVRRVKLKDVEEFPSDSPELAKHSWIATQIEQEWTLMLQDLRWGQFHPYSRSDVDYTNRISKERIYEFEGIGRTRPNKDQQKAAFDLEALKIPHLWVYWGRRNYWDTSITSRNPYPTISTVGLSRFITAIVRLRNKEKIADKYLSTYVWDTGRDDQPFTTVIGKEVKEQSGR